MYQNTVIGHQRPVFRPSRPRASTIPTPFRTIKLGCGACDGLSCDSCGQDGLGQFTGSGLVSSGAGFAASQAASIMGYASVAGPIGSVVGGIASLFMSLFGGGMTKEQKQAGPYLDSAKKFYNKYAAGNVKTPADLLQFMLDVISYSSTTVKSSKGAVEWAKAYCPKWCVGSPCDGAEGRGCVFILPYTIYKQLGGAYTTGNPAYDTFGGGSGMIETVIKPFFIQKLADPSFLAQFDPATVAAVLGTATGTAPGTTIPGTNITVPAITVGGINLTPLLLIGGVVYLIKK